MLQEKAVAAGGFSAPAASLCLEELGVGTPAGWLHRGLLLQVRSSTQSAAAIALQCGFWEGVTASAPAHGLIAIPAARTANF